MLFVSRVPGVGEFLLVLLENGLHTSRSFTFNIFFVCVCVCVCVLLVLFVSSSLFSHS